MSRRWRAQQFWEMGRGRGENGLWRCLTPFFHVVHSISKSYTDEWGRPRVRDIYIHLSLSSKYIYRQTGVSHLVPRWELIKPKGGKRWKKSQDTPGQQPSPAAQPTAKRVIEWRMEETALTDKSPKCLPCYIEPSMLLLLLLRPRPKKKLLLVCVVLRIILRLIYLPPLYPSRSISFSLVAFSLYTHTHTQTDTYRLWLIYLYT